MSEKARNDTGGDEVRRRLQALLDGRRRENEESLAALKSLEDKWEGLNKELDLAIGTEFDLAGVEKKEADAALARLGKVTAAPTDEGFVIAGRIFDDQGRAGLPGVIVRVVRGKGDEEEVLAETTTDAAGNFTGLVPRKLFAGAGAGKATLRVEAMTEPGGRPIASTEKRVGLEAGKTRKVDLAVPSGRKTADRVSAAESVRDSHSRNVEAVTERLASMKTAHTGLTKFADLTRDSLRSLRAGLSVPAPEITAVASGSEPDEPQPPAGGGGTKPKRPPTKKVAKKKAGKKAGAKKAASKKAGAKKVAARKKAVAKKGVAKKAASKKKAVAKKVAAKKKAVAKKAVAKKVVAKKVVAKKAAAKRKTTAKRTTRGSRQ